MQIPVLSRIITNDGACYVSIYDSYGQASHFWRYGQEDNQRACVGYLMDLPASRLADCPRPYLRGDWAVEWFGGWAESYFSFDPSGSLGIMIATNGTIYREFLPRADGKKAYLLRAKRGRVASSASGRQPHGHRIIQAFLIM